MTMRLFRGGLLRAGLALALAGVALCGVTPSLAQRRGGGGGRGRDTGTGNPLLERFPGKPSQPPAFVVTIQPLGFSAPDPLSLNKRNSFASLDFIGEDRLLFTFRVPVLIRREADERKAGEEEERQIRAVVLDLPAGTVEADALWTVHDRDRYLWMLKDGHFLFRDRTDVELGDAALKLKPYLRFPGSLLSMEMDPTQQFLVTDSSEPAAEPGNTPNPVVQPGEKGQPPGIPAAATANNAVEAQKPATQPSMILRIMRLDSRQVMLASRIRNDVHLPINAEGYLETLPAKGGRWLLNLKSFSGGSSILGHVDSACSPLSDFVSQREVLVRTCAFHGEDGVAAIATDGRRLWEKDISRVSDWQLLVMAPDGSRLARETLAGFRDLNSPPPRDHEDFKEQQEDIKKQLEDVKGQLVQVLNAADGKVALVAPASPALDAGGNVAFSPSGRRVAVLNGGQIQVFELPPAPPLPESAAPPPAH
jgi:hypothetical protein